MSVDKTDFYSSLQWSERNTAPSKSNQLGQQEFMKLLITQMEHQDPLNPTENTEFIAQLAQFSSLEGITNLQQTVNQFATTLQSTQALQASTLVGRSVQVQTDWTELKNGKPIQGTVDLAQSSPDVFVAVYTSSGEYIGDIALGSREAGSIHFEWDGLDTEGEPFPEDVYQFRAYASIDGQHEAADLYLARDVTSVTLNAGAGGEIMLNLSGSSEAVPLSKVKAIN